MILKIEGGYHSHNLYLLISSMQLMNKSSNEKFLNNLDGRYIGALVLSSALLKIALSFGV